MFAQRQDSRLFGILELLLHNLSAGFVVRLRISHCAGSVNGNGILSKKTVVFRFGVSTTEKRMQWRCSRVLSLDAALTKEGIFVLVVDTLACGTQR